MVLQTSQPEQKARSGCFCGFPLPSDLGGGKEHHLLHVFLLQVLLLFLLTVCLSSICVSTLSFPLTSIQRNVRVGVGLFCTPGWSHRHTFSASASTSHFLYYTFFLPFFALTLTQPLSSCTPLVVLFLYGFCLASCFADRLQLDVMAGIEAGS